MALPKYILDIGKINCLTKEEQLALKTVTDRFVFRVNDYYLDLINWSDPNDPLRKIVIPSSDELLEYGKWDASDEETNYVVKGCQHKYSTTALLLVSEVCGSYCRFCFRKRLFRSDVRETTSDVSEGIVYIQRHSEINNVLLSGGDPLMLATPKIRKIIEHLRAIDHVKIIRIGTKLPAFNPMRIYQDHDLLALFKQFSTAEKRIYIICHFNHPKEITQEARKAIQALHHAGVILANQTPILKGINDNQVVLGNLLDQLSWAGVTPYYFFVNRPVAGNKSFALPLQEVYQIVKEAKSRTSGLGKRVRLVMSHASGKIEVLAIEKDKAYLKYHQSRYGDHEKLLIMDCPPDATWFDDLPQVITR